MKYAVVTGTSKGLGESIAMLLMKQGVHIIGVARNSNEILEQEAKENSVSYQHKPCDLSNPQAIEAVFTTIAGELFADQTELVFLVNNAGTVEPIHTSGNQTTEALSIHVNVNLLAPMATTNIFLDMARKSNIPLIVSNVTSGAAERSVYGWNAYCSTKAGLNRFTETVALEQNQLGTRNKVFLFDPGKMDTEMQRDIRSASKDAFKDVDAFKQFKKDNILRDTQVVANLLVSILLQENIENGKNYSVKQLL